jgi:hypothetical protein
LLLVLFSPEDGGDIFVRNVTFNGLHGVISQKAERFITTGTSDSVGRALCLKMEAVDPTFEPSGIIIHHIIYHSSPEMFLGFSTIFTDTDFREIRYDAVNECLC